MQMTKCKSVYEIADVYSAPVFQLIDQYPKIMTTILVCMFYGFGMPIMFPLTFFFLLITYISQKLLVVFYYRMTPLQDDTLNREFIYYVKYGVVYFIGVSFWLLTN